MPKTKPKTYSLNLMPRPRGKFTAEKAREWIADMLPQYRSILQDGYEQEPGARRRDWGGFSPYWEIAYDIQAMAEACADAIAGERVRFSRDDGGEPDPAICTFRLLADQATGDAEMRIGGSKDACRALALEAADRLQGWTKDERTREHRRGEIIEELRAQLAAVTEERDGYREHAEDLREKLRGHVIDLAARTDGWSHRPGEEAADAQ